MEDTNKSGGAGSTVLMIALLLAGLTLVALGCHLAFSRGEFVVLAIGVLAIVVTGSVFGTTRAAGGSPGSTDRQTQLLQAIAERMLISDQGKRIAYREKDREALRNAIVEDIRKEDYGAAMALVNDMAAVYGYREEAEKYREQIISAEGRKRQTMIGAAIAQIDQLLAKHDWDSARREVERLTRLFPDHPEVARLPEHTRVAKEKYKADLVREFREAHDRDDIDRASTLLSEMDHYLTPEEARVYVDMARHVLNQKRENLGVQFKMSVQDRDWARAVTVGEQIIREFPNTQFATEAREMLDTLRQRAGQKATA